MRGVLCLVVVLTATVAHAAGPPVVVRDFRGPAAKKLRAGVIAALAHRVHVVKKASMADKVIEGVVAKKGKRYKLTVTVRNAATGTWIDDVVMTLSRPGLTQVARKKLAKKVLPLLGNEDIIVARKGKKKDRSPPPDGEDGDATGAASEFAKDEDGAAETTTPAQEGKTEPARAEPEPPAEAQPKTGKEVAMATPAPAAAAAPAPKAVDTEVVKEQPPPPPRADYLTLGAGATVQTRSFQAVGFGRLPVYNSEPYGSAWVQGALYPLAFLHGFPRGLGLFGTFERALGLRSKIAQTGQIFDSFAQRWEAGMTYKAHFGGATGPTFRPFGLYGKQEFDIGGMSDMPDTNYEYVGGGLELDLPLFVPSIALVGDFQYDDVRQLGGAAMFGTSATAFGYAFEGGLRFDLPWRLHGVATFTDTVRKASFTGMSPTGVTASETRDEWIGGRAALVLDF